MAVAGGAVKVSANIVDKGGPSIHCFFLKLDFCLFSICTALHSFIYIPLLVYVIGGLQCQLEQRVHVGLLWGYG